jgi:hypothetical protein
MRLRDVLTFMAAAGCGSGTACPGSLVSTKLDGGSASVLLDTNATVQASQFAWMNGSPVRFPSISFQFNFDTSGGASTWIGCDGEWATYDAAVQPVSLSTVNCVVDVARPNGNGGFDNLESTLTAGKVTTTSSLDSNGNGTLTVQFDVPSTDLDLTSSATTVHEAVRVQMNGLRGTAAFDTRECPASCSGGINPVI